MKRRHLTAREQTELRQWIEKRARLLDELDQLGTVQQKARALQVSKRTIYVAADRESYQIRRKMREAGL